MKRTKEELEAYDDGYYNAVNEMIDIYVSRRLSGDSSDVAALEVIALLRSRRNEVEQQRNK